MHIWQKIIVLRLFSVQQRSCTCSVHFNAKVYWYCHVVCTYGLLLNNIKKRYEKNPPQASRCTVSWLSASPLDENDAVRTAEVYFGLKSSFARMCEVRHWGEIAGQLDISILIGRLIIIIVLYINRRMSLISSWLSTKTFAIVDISDYRRYTILSSIGTTLVWTRHKFQQR